MGSSGAGMNMNVSNMSGLGTCNMGPDTKPMQFPLSQRRKRRVLFTQAQVCVTENYVIACSLPSKNWLLFIMLCSLDY
jgi:hypothetical protein